MSSPFLEVYCVVENESAARSAIDANPEGNVMAMKIAGALLLSPMLGWYSAAAAQDLRDFCPDRPGLGTPACTIDRGHAAIELGVADWTLDRRAGTRADTFVFGDLLIRYGLTDSLEAQLSWQGAGYVRARDATGGVSKQTGTGDIRLALRQNLANPDGSGFSLAVMPFVTLPTGGSAIGAGDWTAGLLLPISYPLAKDVLIAFTGEIDDAADEQGGGHHLAYSGIMGVDVPLTHSLTSTIELTAARDEEAGQRSTQMLAGLSLAWMKGKSLQFDAGTNLGLNKDAPDVEVYAGVARRF
jgi:hypothetical protein